MGRRFPVPPISNVQEIVALENGALLFRDMSYTEPAAWFEVKAGQTRAGKNGPCQHLTGFIFRYRGNS